MSERSLSPPGRRRPDSAGIGMSQSLGGRGPTYERVQRLLELRRARSQGQSSPGLAPPEHNEVPTAASLARGRLGTMEPSPDSDDSFAFDRPPHASDGGIQGAVPHGRLRGSFQGLTQSNRRHDSSGGGVDAFTLRPWHSATQFEAPLGHLDYDEGDDHFGHGGSDMADPHGEDRHLDDEQPQHPDDLGQEYHPDPEDYGVHYQATERTGGYSGGGMAPDSPGAGPSLAELEEMLNQTVMNMAATETMRVPSSKDMAYGMSQAEGPFDISDIWAMDSQPSGSQVSASNRQVSQSGTEASRGQPDDGQEVNSYMGAYGLAPLGQQQPPLPAVQESSFPGPGPGQHFPVDPSPRRRTGSPAQTLQERLSGLQARIQANQRAQRQQRQCPHPQASPRAVGSPRAAGAGPPTAARQADSMRRLQQRHAALSAYKGSHPHHRQQHQHVRPQSAAAAPQQQQRPLSARALNTDPALLRRPGGMQSSPGGHQYRSGHPRGSPGGIQPFRQAPASVIAARDQAEQDFTFKPRINPRSREIAERLLPMDRERRLEQLSRPRNERVEQRYEQLRQAKEQEELRDCTFHPQTGRPPSTPRLRGDVPVHDRLYNVKPAWQLKRDDILREREAAVLANCTFQPQCGSRQNPDVPCRSSSATRRRPASAAAVVGGTGGRGTPHVPIHQRVADLLRSRNEKLAKAQIRMELGGGSVTFQPEINRRSVHLAAERQRQQPAEVAALPAGERLYRLAQEQAAGARHRGPGDDPGASGMRDVSATRDQRQQQPPGVPSINPRSRALAESSDLPQDFLARQAYLAALGHEKRALYRSLLEESTCTFQPQLLSRGGSVGPGHSFGPLSRPGSARKEQGSLSTSVGEGDRLSKLAYEDVQRSAALREALEQHHYGQFTFAPAINERSRRIGRRHSLTDLYRDEERQAKLERLAAEAEAQRAAECTFHPAINARSASLGRQRRGSLVLASADCHEQANKLRSSILTEARALKEYEELKECTFTPAINRAAPKTGGPVAVPGLGRHMELRDLARRKREADEARKAEVWNARPRSPGPRAGFTIPKPFSFETRVLPWQMPGAQQSQHQQEQQQQQKALAALKQQRQQQRKDAEDRRSAQLRKILQEVQAAGDDPQLLQQLQHHQQPQHHHHPQQRQQQQQGYAMGGHPRDGEHSGAVVAYVPPSGAAHGAAHQPAEAAMNGRGSAAAAQSGLNPRPALATRNGVQGGGGGGGQRRSVTFMSPVAGWSDSRGYSGAYVGEHGVGEDGAGQYDDDNSSLNGVAEMPPVDGTDMDRGYGYAVGRGGSPGPDRTAAYDDGGDGYGYHREGLEEDEDDYGYPDSPARQEYSLRF